MPGLFGVIALDPRAALDRGKTARLLREMAARMSHTGGETVEIWGDEARGFAVGRIGLPHLRSIRWPELPSGDGSWLFLDGYLYPHSLSARDYRRQLGSLGADGLTRLHGDFAAVIYTPPPERRVILATDRRAARQVFYTVVDGHLYFAPEVKALLAVTALERKLDPGAAALLLSSGYVLAQQTLIQGVERLLGGRRLVVADGTVRLETYWDYHLTTDGDGTPPAELAEELIAAIRTAVTQDFCDPDHDVIFLSGGVDSRAITAVISELPEVDPRRLQAVSWGAAASAGRVDDPTSDVAVARRVAQTLDLDHRFLPRSLDSYGSRVLEMCYILDGLSDVPSYHPYEYELMLQLAAEGAHRVLRGDECFGFRHKMKNAAEAFLEVELRPLSAPTGWRRLFEPVAYARFCAASEQALAAAIEPFDRDHPDSIRDQAFFRHRIQSYQHTAGYFKRLVLDHRAPLIADEILDMMVRLSVKQRRDKVFYNRALAATFPELWRIPEAGSGSLEDYGAVVAGNAAVRRAVELELGDRTSALWEVFKRDVLLDDLAAMSRSPAKERRWTSRAKDVVRAGLRKVPGVENRVRAAYRRRITRPDEVFLRLLVLKQAFDLFIVGDGSRRVFEERRKAYRELEERHVG